MNSIKVIVWALVFNTIFIEVGEIFVTILIICTISLGLLIKRKPHRVNKERMKAIVVFLLIFGTSFFSLYLFYVYKAEGFDMLSIDKVMSVIVGSSSILLLLKIKYDLDNDTDDSLSK